MNPLAARELLDAFDPAVPIAAAWTPPAPWYTDPGFHDLERRAVFHRSWQPVARTADLRDAGNYASGCFASEPWLVVRGEDGVLRAFHNVCRHKGREVVTGTGTATSLVCGYHAWTYDLDGALRHATRISGIEDFDPATMALAPMQVEAWGPWVFINLDPGAAPLRDRLGELERRLDDSGWHDLVLVGQRRWTLECNWKVYADNYLDGGYHIPHMHPTLDAQLDMRSYRTELFDEFSIQTSAPNAGGDARIDYDARDRIGSAAIYAWVFPNFMINRYGDWLDSNHVVPLGADRCEVVYEFYRDAATLDDPQAVDASLAQSDVTQREDIEICESVQRGLRSTSYDRGRYAPRVEMGEHHFHCLLHARLVAALGG